MKMIVARHPAVAEFVRAERPDFAGATVLDSTVTAEDVFWNEVAGVLPLHLIVFTARFWAVEFSGAPPRGVEYGLDEMRAAGARLVEYRVEVVE